VADLIIRSTAGKLALRPGSGTLSWDGNTEVTDNDAANRREEPRAPIKLRVEYKRLNSFFADYTRNIGRGGTFIRTHQPLPIGTEFTFALTVPTLAEPLALRGRVQWTVHPDRVPEDCEPGMGIGFVFESEAERHRVQAVVEALFEDSLGPQLARKVLRGDKP
jgi:type IV pilus assembly protein PilZ